MPNKNHKTDIEQLEKFNILPDNTEIVDLETQKSRVGKFILYPSISNVCSNMLARDIMDYAKNGGDMNQLTFQNIYKNQIQNNNNIDS